VVYYTYFQQSGSQAPTSQPQTSAPKVIKIGALLPLTGQLSSVGAEAEQALMYAQDQANALLKQQGVNMRVQIVIEDTGTNPQTALSDLQTLYSQGVRLVIGPFSSGELRQIMPYAESNGIMLFSLRPPLPRWRLRIGSTVLYSGTCPTTLIKGL
jgi:ABC-type branched-chain amino acid transport systems, periplasmic component